MTRASKLFEKIGGTCPDTGIEAPEFDVTTESFPPYKLNERAEKEYSSFKAWQAAAKKVNPKVWYDGDEDIAQALVGSKPFKSGKTYSVGEWDGETGYVISSDDEEVLKGKLK